MAYGATLVGHIQGSTISAQIRSYVVDAGDSTALYIGDFVKTDGTVGAVTVAGETYPAVVKADNGDTVRGVVMGVDQVIGVTDALGAGGLLYRPALTQRVLYVCDDPYAIFMIQSNSAIVITKIGENADIVYAAGSTYTGLSGTTVSATTATSSKQLRLLGIAPLPNNTPAGAATNMLVMINAHELKSTTGV